MFMLIFVIRAKKTITKKNVTSFVVHAPAKGKRGETRRGENGRQASSGVIAVVIVVVAVVVVSVVVVIIQAALTHVDPRVTVVFVVCCSYFHISTHTQTHENGTFAEFFLLAFCIFGELAICYCCCCWCFFFVAFWSVDNNLKF